MITFLSANGNSENYVNIHSCLSLCLRQTVITTFSNFLGACMIFHEVFHDKIVFFLVMINLIFFLFNCFYT